MEQTGPSARARQAADRAGCPAPPFHNNSNNYGASPITLPMSSRHVSQVSQRRPPSLQVKGDEAFNRWSRRIGEMQAKKMGGPIVEVRIGRLGPVRSRIQALEINQAARLADKQLADPRRTSPLPFLRAGSISRNGVT